MPRRECRFSDGLKLSEIKVAFTGSRTNMDSDTQRGEYHNYWEFIYMLSGKGRISADDKLYVLSEGEIIFFKPMQFHIYCSEEKNSRIFVMSFDLDGDKQSLLNDAVFKLSSNQKNLIENLINLMYERAGIAQEDEMRITGGKRFDLDLLDNWDSDNLFTRSIKNAAELLFIDIIRNSAKAKQPYESKSAMIYRNIVSIMEENIYGWISIEEIAKKCCFSVPYIKKIFAKYTGSGIHNYFIKLKIKEAIHLIEKGYSVQRVSDKLAFSSPNYFGIVFKRETGYSPMKHLNKDVSLNVKNKKK